MSATETAEQAALRAKYREERDKRVRPDGNEQYLEPTGRFAHFLDDPYVPRVEREPLFDEVTVAFIGGGFSGLVTGARLKQAGIADVRLIEGGGDFGGAWYWNRYPGAMCDTAAMVYLPLLEETGHMPSQKYVFAPEIFGHAKRIATTFGLYDNALFSTQVSKLEWDDESSRWIIHTDRGDRIRARFVAMGTGPLHRPKLPGIPGIDTFAGHAFHTSRWDYEYTGGDPAPRWSTSLASAWASSAPVPPRCSASPTWLAMPASCSSSSERRRRSMCATTAPSTRSGSPHWRRAGSSDGSPTSPPCRRVASPTKTW
ncbi:MAG: NAD(P)/FAD-dependent oxidoreductase [Ilumatobacteraceae bacterium]|nr:NAD(P)/FAD-dependent oxidoreductase [Ilumatobacteraceae bacterium]